MAGAARHGEDVCYNSRSWEQRPEATEQIWKKGTRLLAIDGANRRICSLSQDAQAVRHAELGRGHMAYFRQRH